MNFIEGQEIWLLENYWSSKNAEIKKCIYRGNKDIQIITESGALGMTRSIGNSELFETLEQLKEKLITYNEQTIKTYQTEIDNINEYNEYIKSLKDIKEDRERKITELLK